MIGHDFNQRIVDEVAHRPYAMPASPWVMTQTWHDLLFAHWPVDPARMRELVPPVLPVDVFGGTAWVGIVPFRMTNVTLRGMPPLPGVSEFPELNVRTYVTVDDRPGVYFFSLDAGSRLAVRAARLLLNLPYHFADMTAVRCGDCIAYRSRRVRGAAGLVATYAPTGPSSPPAPGSLEYFLTERYCLYHLTRRGVPYRLEIHHPPWPLQLADVEIETNTMAAASGIVLPDAAPLVHFSRRQDMVGWGREILNA